MAMLSIFIFFAITFGLGYAATRIAKESENFLERNLMRIGIGLGAFIVLGLVFNIARAPLDYRIFLGIALLSAAFCAYVAIKAGRFQFRLSKSDIFSIAMLVLFATTFFMYHKGAFAYPYLEDDDSWGHALGVKYVAIEKTVFAENSGIRYIDPYPPGYDMVLGMMHQTNNSVYWTLKFFNALIASLSIIFFYFFAKAFTNSPKKALFSAFALFAIPSFLSHFIWAITITMPLFFVSFYSLEKIKDDKRWWIVSAVAIAATLATSPSHSTYFGLFFIAYLAAKSLLEGRFLFYDFISGASGAALSAILWWLPITIKHGIRNALSGIGANVNTTTSIFDIAGTADRIYGLKDFFTAQKANMINNPIGVGIVLSLLVAISFIFLLFRHYKGIAQNKIKITLAFLIAITIMMLVLSHYYVKYVTKRNNPQLSPGSVPFFEFLSEQFLLVFVLSIAIFLLVSTIAVKIELKEHYMAVTLAWFILAFFSVNAGPFYYKLSPFRAWMLLAIPVSLLAGDAMSSIGAFAKSLAKSLAPGKMATIVSFIVIGIIGYGIIMTSFVQKYSVNTALWGPGGFWTSNEEIQGYVWLKENIPADTKVFTFSNNALVIGLDKFICHWCADVQDYRAKGFNQTPEQNHEWLKEGKYNYVIIDGQATRKFGFNETNSKVQSLIGSGRFKPVFSNNGMIIFGVV